MSSINCGGIYEKKRKIGMWESWSQIQIDYQISYRTTRLISMLKVGNVYFTMFCVCKTKRENNHFQSL